MDTPETPTEDLLHRAEQGDDGARAELLTRHRARLLRVVAARMDRRLRVRLDPSDVVQEALVQAHQRLPAYLRDRPLPFFPWLRQLVCNRLVDLYREHVRARRRSVLREEDRLPALTGDSAVALAEALAASQTSPSGQAHRRELREALLATLSRLAEKDQEVLVLRYLEGLSTEEMAAVLGISAGAVKVRHFRALKRVRELMATGEGGYG